MKTIVMLTACAVMTAGAELVQVGTDPLDHMPMMADSVAEAAVMNRVMKRQSFVFRGEVLGDKTYIVGVDGMKREVVLLDPDEYKLLTKKVEDAWAFANSTEEGRVKIHGKRVNTNYTETEKATTYADGHIYREPIKDIKKKREASKHTEDAGGRKVAAKRPNGYRYSARYHDFKRLLEERKRSKSKELNIEYNATTGETKEVK